MTDIAFEAAAFAGIMGERPPPLETDVDLLDYAERIALTLNRRALIADLRDGQAKSFRRKSRLTGLAERRELQLKAQKRQGQETRPKVKAAQRAIADRPKPDQAALIAKRLNMPVRTVRSVLQSIKNNDK
jgi:hypothetical protein